MGRYDKTLKKWYRSVKKVSSVFSEEKCSQNFNAECVDACNRFMFINKRNHLNVLKLGINCHISNTEIASYRFVECCLMQGVEYGRIAFCL